MKEKSTLQASYDLVAPQYAQTFFNELNRKPFDRMLLDRFADQVRQRGQVWDIGCGPGHIGRYLQEHGITVSGLDLSAQMIACAQQLNPQIPFIQGTMLALPISDETLAGIVSFYAIIHLTRTEITDALREFRRALQPGGHLLLAFHGGQGEVHTDEWFGEKVNVSVTLFEPAEMAQYVQEAGFAIVDRLERPPYDFEYQSRRIYFFAKNPEQTF